MTTNARARAAALNREIIDDRPDRLSIHTHRIRLTQANLPYQSVPGKRLPSTKHFTVYADQIVLDGPLQNPGRDIELHAREIVIEKPATLDVAGAWPDKDFAPGDAPIQKDATPGAAGTDGADGTDGGNAGTIAISAQRLVSKADQARELSVSDTGAIAARVFADHPPKVDDAMALASFEIGRMKLYGDNVMVVSLDQARVEGLGAPSLVSSSFDASSSRLSVRLSLPKLTMTGVTQFTGNRRISSNAFSCTIDAVATFAADGAITDLRSDLSLTSDKPIALPVMGETSVAGEVLTKVRDGIAAHLGAKALEPFLKAFVDQLRTPSLVLLAAGARGGRGQDGHAGNRGESGPDGAKTSRHGALVNGQFGFPEEAIGQSGEAGGRAGSPGKSGNGGNGGRIAVDVCETPQVEIVYSLAGGEGGTQARPGDRGPGGRGGQGAVCHMFDGQTGKPLDDMKAPDGHDGPPGPEAKSTGSKGKAGSAGQPLQLNGAAFTGSAVPAYSIAELAPTLSLSQLLITQNAFDQDFLNAVKDEEFAAVAGGYTWLVIVNDVFTADPPTVDTKRVTLSEQRVRARIHDSAIVSLMRLQQGLDFYGHSYNWTPVLTLNNLLERTGQLIQLGKVVEDQFNRYLDKALTDKERMQAFGQAKQEIDRKLAQFDTEIDKLMPQIESFQAEVDEYSESLRRQRTVLLEGQLAFKAELIEYLRKEHELGFEDFLDILGTLIGCVGGVVEGAGGVKTAIDAVKKAEGFAKQVKGVVEIFKKAKATIENIKKAYSTIKDAIDESHPNAGKILVDGDEFDKLLEEYLDKVDAAGELKKAMKYYVTLAQARNMAAYNYSTLVSQVLSLQTQRDQLHHGIEHINAEIAAHQDNMLPIYTAYLKDALEDLQRNLLRNIYQENRAYQYWALRTRTLQTSDLNIATLAATHERLIADIDSFRETNEAFSDFRQKVVISADRYPNEFAALRASRVLTVALDIRNEPGFQNLRYVIARSFTLAFPDIADDAHVLFLNLTHSGQAVLNSDTDLDKAGAIHVFSHRPRVGIYKIDYGDRRNTAGGNLGEDKQGYIGLSPFTTWRLDFDLKGNEWLDPSRIRTVELTFSGRALGPGAHLH